ncbi:thiolase C-terminal domain-containing protein [Saccharopolyspora karakumensis]|uniref:thiolase C-terminal domain-containing protein n=1 Tax=Saccharopolyspora karakumensis TaxID=2530386 RepID=UPI0038B452F6
MRARGFPDGVEIGPLRPWSHGVSQIVLAGMQLTGTAGDLQLPGADRAAVHNMGGLAVANYVSVLESRLS